MQARNNEIESDSEREVEVEVLFEIEIPEEIFPNGKLLVIAYGYKDHFVLCIKVDELIYMVSVSGIYFHNKTAQVTSVDVQGAHSVVLNIVKLEPYGKYELLLKNVDFSRNPMCSKIVEAYENYYNNNGNEYILK